MSKEIALKANVTVPDIFVGQDMDLVRQTFGRGANTVATDEEWNMFLGLARSSGLNPYNREIWLVPYVRNGGQRQTLIMVGIQGLRRVANEHPAYDGMETEIIEDPTDKKKPIQGTCRVYRKDRTRPESVTLFFNETARKDGDYGRWSVAPKAQFVKCLEAAALRKAFPVLGGAYIEEEVGYNPQTGVIEAEFSEPKITELKRELAIAANGTPEPVVVAQDSIVEGLLPEEDAFAKAEYRYEIMAEEDKAKTSAMINYAGKQGAMVDINGGVTTIISKKELPKLANYEVA